MSSIDSATSIATLSAWLAPSVHLYVTWLRERRVRDVVVRRRVVELTRFASFAQARGIVRVEQLPELLVPFVDDCVEKRSRPCRSPERLAAYSRELQRPIQQLLDVALPGHRRENRPDEPTFFGQAVGFFEALREERGLRPATVRLYRDHLRRFEQFLAQEGLSEVDALQPAHLDRFIVAVRSDLCLASLPALCSALRLLLRWLYREQRISRDLSDSVEAPSAYRLATLPRSISWAEVERTLAAVDRQTPIGRRDYAMLVLIVVYGLRAREVAALTLDDLDWKGERLHVGSRKAGHSTTYPLSPLAAEALIAYLREGRPSSNERRIFLQARPPRGPVNYVIVGRRVSHYLGKAGVVVRRAGSHTLRHSCAQRLVDADFSLKAIGDYLGHRSPVSTEVYTKVAVETLRQVALGEGEVVL